MTNDEAIEWLQEIADRPEVREVRMTHEFECWEVSIFHHRDIDDMKDKPYDHSDYDFEISSDMFVETVQNARAFYERPRR